MTEKTVPDPIETLPLPALRQAPDAMRSRSTVFRRVAAIGVTALFLGLGIYSYVVTREPKMFDPDQPMRVAVNGQVPESKLIHMEIGDLLEDYRERRDTDLLYCCRLRFAVRGR